MLAGHRPYPGLDRNRSQLEQAIRTNAPREPLPPTVPTHLQAIVSKLLAYQPERRYGNAAAIRADLQRFLDGTTPEAVAEYATPATTRIGQPATARIIPPIVDAVPATDPLPMPVTPGPAAVVAPPAKVRRFGGLRHLARNAAWAAVLLILIGVVATEGVGWLTAEGYRRSIQSIDGRTLSGARAAYDLIRSRSVLGTGLKLRVDAPLRSRLVAIADEVIEDYRREEPTMAAAEWKQAQQALRWAAELSPHDRRLLARLTTCEAHVIRLGARGQSPASARLTYRRAIEKFRAAAEIDKESFDPYLGISRSAVYGLGDVDQAAAAIQEAESRGYVSGRRERALLGDGYLRRANASRTRARLLSGDQRTRELEKARADYQGCIDAFDPIVGFGYAAKNMEVCKGGLELVVEELEMEMETERVEGT
jgi:tetratricopeptide (TPR) repeat protein